MFQIACHRSVVSLQQLYEWCRIARRLLSGPFRVGRVIARPFEGTPGAFVRSAERRDFSVPPPEATVLDALQDAGVAVYGVGKIQDIFCGQGITEARYSESNDHGVDLTLEYLRRPGPAFVFANLVDFDSKYGHRNDPSATPTRSRRSTPVCPRSSPRSAAASCSSRVTTAATPPRPLPITPGSGHPCSLPASAAVPGDRHAGDLR